MSNHKKLLFMLLLQALLLNRLTRNDLFSFPLQQGWPVIINDDIGNEVLNLRDLDNDGTTEVLFSSNMPFWVPNSGKLYVYSYDGTPFLPVFPMDLGAGLCWCATGDLDLDGDFEVVLQVSASRGPLIALHHDGTSVTGWPVESAFHPIISDINGDSSPEVLAALGASDRMRAFSNYGEPVVDFVTGHHCEGMAAVGDINGNGDTRIAVGTGPYGGSSDGVYQFYSDGSLVPGWPRAQGQRFNNPTTMADVNEDDIMEIIAQDQTGKHYLWKADGSEMYREDDYYPLLGWCEVVPHDLDGDGDLELIFFVHYYWDSHDLIDARHHDGKSVSGWPQYVLGDPGGGAGFEAGVRIADIDGDHTAEILVATTDVGPTAYIYAWETNGVLCDSFPIVVTDAYGVKPGAVDIAISDLDGDGDVEIVLTAWEMSISQGIFKTIVYAWDLPGAWHPEASPWPQWHQGPRRTGSLPIGGYPFVGEHTSLSQTEQVQLYATIPNPFSNLTNITYALPKATKISLKIYNILGQEVRVLENTVQEPGYYEVTWNGKDQRERSVANGVYFLKMEADDFAATQKMLLLR